MQHTIKTEKEPKIKFHIDTISIRVELSNLLKSE